MSMYRQLWLAIIVSMLFALCGSLLASLLSARAYLEHQLSTKNADNASALALSLSQQNPDAVTIELAVAALFDSGHYRTIRVHDPNGKLIIERSSAGADPGVPGWFVRLLPIHPDPGEAQITNGWNQVGVVTLESHSRFGYRAVWSGTQKMLAALALASLIGGYLGSLILRRLKKPLAAVIEQAVAITNRRFVTIPQPDVPELYQLAGAMNSTVTRIKQMFEEEAARIEALRREVNHDALTGLANRDHMIADLRSGLEEEGSTGVTFYLVRVAGLHDINQRIGREATDDMLCRVGISLEQSAAKLPDAIPARMNGADFALLVRGKVDGRPIAQELLGRLVAALEPFVDAGPSAFIGFGSYPQGTPLRLVLSQVDAALLAAEAEGRNDSRETVPDAPGDLPEDGNEWAEAISTSVARGQVKLVRFPVIGQAENLLHHECPLRLRISEDADWLPAGRFLAVAERLGLVRELDLAALALGLKALDEAPEGSDLAVNLSARTLSDPKFLSELGSLLNRHRQSARRLWIEVSEAGAVKHIEEFRGLCHLLRENGCRVGIEHFGRQLSEIGRLYDLGLNYAKFDASFVRRIDTSPGNQTFLKGAAAMVRKMGMLAIAEGVSSDAEMQTLFAIGLDGVTGPGVRPRAGA